MTPLNRNAKSITEDVSVDGAHTQRWIITSTDCPALNHHRISRLGVDQVRHPYQRVRIGPSGSFLMVVLEGHGQILLEGRWQKLSAGWAAMAPPRVMNAFHATKGQEWRFAWIRYDEPPPISPVVNAESPLKLKVDAGQLGRVWEGLHQEQQDTGDPRALHHWIELLQVHVRRLTEPWRREQRLRLLWEEVGPRLSEAWSITTLASLAHVSEEHLRRLCWKELGRSPMAHLTFMRMQVARQLLTASGDKIDFIAKQTGYSTPEAFTRCFSRWIGCTPSDYRSGQAGQESGF
jgi:AraC-like DNA-binding protein